MSAVTDIYKLIKDLIDEAKEQKNIELVEKLIDIKLTVTDLKDENELLKKKLEINESIERHAEGNYITLKNDSLNIKYCSTCWGKDNKLIQLMDETESTVYPNNCPVCFNDWLKARNSGM